MNHLCHSTVRALILVLANTINKLALVGIVFAGCSSPEKAAVKTDTSTSPVPTVSHQAPCQSLWETAIYSELSPFLDQKASSKTKKSIVYRIVFPENAEEFKKMNGMAILGVRVFQKPSKKPLIYLKTYATDLTNKGVISWLPAIFPKVKTFTGKLYRNPAKPDPNDIVSLHIQEVYLFVPISNLQKQGVLAEKFDQTQEILKFEQLPLRHPFFEQEFVTQLGPLRDLPEAAPDPSLTVDKLSKLFCF